MALVMLSPELSQVGAGRAYLEQVQCDRHGLQLPQQVHGSLLEGEGTFIKGFQPTRLLYLLLPTGGTKGSNNLDI